MRAYDANGNLLQTVNTPSNTNAVQQYSTNISGVRRLEFSYNDSRGVGNILLDCPLEGCCDGNATAVVSGGTAPYTFAWSTGAAAAFSGDSLCAATYLLTVTDAFGCSVTDSVEILDGVEMNSAAVSICAGDLFNGTPIFSDTTFVDSLVTPEGCDSIVQTSISVFPKKDTVQNIFICAGNSFFAGGAFQTLAGTY
jgi:hypothetical protein